MMSKKLLVTIILLAAASLLGGCAQLQPPALPSATGAFRVTGLLHYSQALLQADPASRLAILNGAKSAYSARQTPTTTAHLALAYGQPGYKGYAPENGWRYAHKALSIASDDFWGRQATTFLQQFAQLCADNDSVHDQLDTAQQYQQRLNIELTKLHQELAAANAKLQALTRIESKLKP